MGIGPVPATGEGPERRRARRWINWTVIELNEAFAAQVLAVIRTWGVEPDDGG